MKKALVALARRFDVIMHCMWVDATPFRWDEETAATKSSNWTRQRRDDEVPHRKGDILRRDDGRDEVAPIPE